MWWPPRLHFTMCLGGSQFPSLVVFDFGTQVTLASYNELERMLPSFQRVCGVMMAFLLYVFDKIHQWNCLDLRFCL